MRYLLLIACMAVLVGCRSTRLSPAPREWSAPLEVAEFPEAPPPVEEEEYTPPDLLPFEDCADGT